MATTSVYYPQVNFEFDNNPDPIIRRKNNIASARKVLMPARQWGIPGYPKYNDHGVCCVTGVQLLSLGSEAYNKPLLDPDTLSPLDNGETLYSHFFSDMAGHHSAFTAMMYVDRGAPLRSSYCPELLQLYWLYSQWKIQEQEEAVNERSSFLWKKRRIKMIPKQIEEKERAMPTMVEELEPLMKIVEKYEGKGVTTGQYQNPLTREVDFVQIMIDLRVARANDIPASLSDATVSEGRGP
jgi:hypothetical protein